MSCKDNRCKYNHDGIACCVVEKIAIPWGGGLLEAGGLLNFSRLRLGAYYKEGGLIKGNMAYIISSTPFCPRKNKFKPLSLGRDIQPFFWRSTSKEQNKMPMHLFVRFLSLPHL